MAFIGHPSFALVSRAWATEAPTALPRAAHSLAACVSRIQGALLAVTEAAPRGTPTPAVRDMLAYVLHARWHWPVKFCTRARSPGAPPCRARPLSPFLDAVLVVAPSAAVQCLVDLDFRAKFTVDGSPGAEVLGTVPHVYMGSPAQLTADLQTWAAPVARAFQRRRRTLPPWRSQGTLLRMYTACLDCDATPSYACLRDIERRLAQGPGEPEPGTASACPSLLDGPQLVCLRTLLGPLRPPADGQPTANRLPTPPPPTGAAPRAADDVPDDYFEKEDCPAPTPAEGPSGLSVLMCEAAARGGGARAEPVPKEGAQATARGWVARILLWW